MHTQCLADFKYQLQKRYLIYGPFILKFIIWKPCFFVVSEKGHPIRYSLKEQRKDFLWIFSANFNQMSWHWMPSLWWPNKSNSSIWQQNTGNLFPCFCKFWKVTYFCGVHKIILANILSSIHMSYQITSIPGPIELPSKHLTTLQMLSLQSIPSTLVWPKSKCHYLCFFGEILVYIFFSTMLHLTHYTTSHPDYSCTEFTGIFKKVLTTKESKGLVVRANHWPLVLYPIL